MDAEDLPRLSAHRWGASSRSKSGKSYARTRMTGDRLVWMHRFILGLSERTVQVDHISGDTFDNRKANLRVCDNAQNQANRRQDYGMSRYKGVYHKGRRWAAHIRIAGRRVYLGTYPTEREAAIAYDAAAMVAFGEFAALNLRAGRNGDVPALHGA